MDAYPRFDDEQKAWFMTIIEGMVSNPEAANFARVKGSMDMEIRILVVPEDAHIFTPDVCTSLARLLGVVTNTSPVVYLDGQPHPAAQEAICATLHNC